MTTLHRTDPPVLQAVGFWISGLTDERNPAPQEMVGDMPANTRQRIVDYLREGYPCRMFAGYSWCLFGCGINHRQMGCRDLTDGSWVWPEGLGHYVSEHGVTLPAEFIQHTLTSVPNDEKSKKLAFDITLNYEVWTDWAAARRWPEVIEKLRNANLKAIAYNRFSVALAVFMRSWKRGWPSRPCKWRGCHRAALRGMYICAKHDIDTEATKDHAYYGRASAEFHSILKELSRRHGLVARFSDLA